MASAMIHIAVANELNKTLKRDNRRLLIGSIAPDIAKQVGRDKHTSHFSTLDNNDIPDLDLFLRKYQSYLNDDFVLGYYIHLYTDYLWFKYFMTEIENENHMITTLNGDIVKCDKNLWKKYVYNDYTNLNIQIIDKYELDLKIFYEELPHFESIIEEIPMNDLQVLVDNMGIIISNSKERKELIFNMENIETFIKTSTGLILNNIMELKTNS